MLRSLAICLFFLLNSTQALAVPELGLSVGTPAGINLQGGVWERSLVVRASGMYYGDRSQGIAGELGIPFDQEGSFWQYMGVMYISATYDYYRRWEGFGPSYGFNASGFQLQAGLTFGSGSFASPQATLQIGYSFIPKD